MSYWYPLIQLILQDATRPEPISTIQRECNRRRGVDTPSAPCVKGFLLRKIEAREVVGLKGAGGSVYFALVSKMFEADGRIRTGFLHIPRSSTRSLRGRDSRFNQMVITAVRTGGTIPLPFTARAPRTTTTAATEPIPVAQGPIAPEPVRESLPSWLTEISFVVDSEVTDALENVREVGAGRWAGVFSAEQRSYLTVGDIREALAAAREALRQKAEHRKLHSTPQTVIAEFISRVEALKAEDDG